MKNILGNTENLQLFNKEGEKVYSFTKYSSNFSSEYTYNSNGNELTYKDSKGYSSEYTYDSNFNPVTFKNSDGYSWEKTYDSDGNVLTFKNSEGYSSEYTYDLNFNLLTFKDSNSVMRGFDVPEYTMEELVAKLGNFKIKK